MQGGRRSFSRAHARGAFSNPAVVPAPLQARTHHRQEEAGPRPSPMPWLARCGNPKERASPSQRRPAMEPRSSRWASHGSLRTLTEKTPSTPRRRRAYEGVDGLPMETSRGRSAPPDRAGNRRRRRSWPPSSMSDVVLWVRSSASLARDGPQFARSGGTAVSGTVTSQRYQRPHRSPERPTALTESFLNMQRQRMMQIPPAEGLPTWRLAARGAARGPSDFPSQQPAGSFPWARTTARAPLGSH